MMSGMPAQHANKKHAVPYCTISPLTSSTILKPAQAGFAFIETRNGLNFRMTPHFLLQSKRLWPTSTWVLTTTLLTSRWPRSLSPSRWSSMSCPLDNSRRWFTGKQSTTKSHNWLKRVCEMTRKRRKKLFFLKQVALQGQLCKF